MNNILISDKIPELDIAIKAAQEAGDAILEIYQKDYNTFTKTDDSPVTDADLKSNKIINEILSIKLSGQNYSFIENFNLKGIPHESETSKYFTWEYEGVKNIIIDSMEEVTIAINPNDNVMGSVSIDIIKKKGGESIK